MKVAGPRRDSETALKPTELRWHCPPIKPSRKAPTAASLLGQDRPMQALRAGLSLHGPGYNIFVSGLLGSGRTTVVRFLLSDIKPVCRGGPDRVYVHDFREPHRPLLLNLPAGRGEAFRRQMQELGKTIQDSLQAALHARPHRMSRRVVISSAEARERRVMEALSRQAQRTGCALVQFQSQGGGSAADIYPIYEGEPVTLDALSALVIEGKVSEANRDKLLKSRENLLERLEEVGERVREELRRMQGELRQMDLRVARRVLKGLFTDFRERWPQPEVADYLDAVGEYVEMDLERWTAPGDGNGEAENNGAAEGAPPVESLQVEGGGIAELSVRVMKTSRGDQCPIVVETNPTYTNLFGVVEPPRDPQRAGALSQIHAGALLRADGGFLILRAVDVLREPGVWPQLKRTLQTGKVEIREFDQAGGPVAGSLQPQAIPIDLKVVMIGEPGVFEALAIEDDQFPQVFKIHAEFDSSVPVNKTNLRRYADYLQWLSRSEGLRAYAPDAAAAVAEYGARVAGRRDRLITRFGELGDIAREAAYVCEQEGAGPVTRNHVETALAARRYRHDLPQELVEREYASGYTRLSTSGRAVGQINALTVIDTGNLEFGRPCRITANTGVAVATRAELVNIEGEAALSGPIHDKGVMILEGYLLMKFGSDGPLCLQATVCFEQLYNMVEGDSASLSQLLALLSSLSGMPVEQGLAVTGSMNQKGEVQAVGAVNEKTEGFYRLCRTRRLTGRQGVVLPRANAMDLMLDHDVVEAVGEGRFQVHAVERVEDALALVTGRPADEVLEAVRQKLRHYREMVRGG